MVVVVVVVVVVHPEAAAVVEFEVEFPSELPSFDGIHSEVVVSDVSVGSVVSSDVLFSASLFRLFSNVIAFKVANLHANTVVPANPSVNNLSDDEYA